MYFACKEIHILQTEIPAIAVKALEDRRTILNGVLKKVQEELAQIEAQLAIAPVTSAPSLQTPDPWLQVTSGKPKSTLSPFLTQILSVVDGLKLTDRVTSTEILHLYAFKFGEKPNYKRLLSSLARLATEKKILVESGENGHWIYGRRAATPREAHAGTAAKPARPRREINGRGLKGAHGMILAAIDEGLTVGQIARKVYGRSSLVTRQRVYSAMHQLQKQNRVIRGKGKGVYVRTPVA